MSEKVDLNVVDNVRHPLALVIRSLLSKQGRVASGQFIIDDEENIIQALQANVVVTTLFLTEDLEMSDKLQTMLPSTLSVVKMAKRTSKKIFGGERMSRIFAISDVPTPISVDALTRLNKDVVVLENLSVSGNVGAIIRTSLALNAGAMIFLDADYVDVYDRRVIRSSRGYVFKMPIITMETNEFVQLSRQHGLKLLVTTPHAKNTVDQVADYKNPLAIIFGREKEGCSSKISEAADFQAKIPLHADVESLNVSVAASIILYLRRNFNH